jgi:hypothetical protein
VVSITKANAKDIEKVSADGVSDKFLQLAKKLDMEYPENKKAMLKEMLAKKSSIDLKMMDSELNTLLSKSNEDATAELEGFLLKYLA